jgi:hypothetical protein
MAYSFKQIFNPVLRRLFETIFDVSSGHDHDGTNSKAVTVGTVADNAVTTAKILNDAVTTDKILNANVTAAKLATDAVETAKILNANVTPAKLSTAAATRVYTYQIEDLAAGGDITDRVIFFAPTGINVTLASAKIVPQGSAAGIDAGNTCVIALKDDAGNTIVTKTYNDGTPLPSSGAIGDLGSLDGTYKALSAGEKLTLSVTNGATANPPAVLLEVTYLVADA